MKINIDNRSLELTPSAGGYTLDLEGKTLRVEVTGNTGGELRLLLDGQPVRASVSAQGEKRWVTINGQTWQLSKQAANNRRSGQAHHPSGELTAPMPGAVRAVNVGEGDSVSKGQTLLVLEAMKMEIKIAAPMDGVVQKLLVKQGQTVEKEQQLVQIG